MTARLDHSTPAGERAFLIFYVGVTEREAASRRLSQSDFAATLDEWAAKARRQAAAIDTSPAQGDLFGESI